MLFLNIVCELGLKGTYLFFHSSLISISSDGSAALPTPEQLETFLRLTKCSPRSIPFYASAPVGWLEVPLLQYMRRSLAHVVYESAGGGGGGLEELPHTKIWKYQHGANDKDSSGRLR